MDKEKVVLTKEEYKRLKEKADMFDEVLLNISDRILQKNLEAYKELASENWSKK